ncbi:4'-phosphopantetheinyl transferase superfamily protein [Candidatus Gracilibacteria bacterium]|nr:4'-phosphopantetheinyl transferase superfamily protein [Candidatus Gracilibacteria bacterium]
MIQLFIQHFSEAQKGGTNDIFPKYFFEKYSPQQIQARKLVYEQTGILFADNFQQGNTYRSFSYTKNMMFIGIAEEKIGVDIEKGKIRDTSVFQYHSMQEYQLFGGKNWENFYRLWTIKESCIKYLGLQLDDMKDIFVKHIEKKQRSINKITFDTQTQSHYKNQTIQTIQGKRDDLFYAVSYDF